MSGAALAFAQNCTRYGIGTPQCPESSLRYWSDYTKRQAPHHWDTYYAPLMAQLDPQPPTGASQLTLVDGKWVVTPVPSGAAPEVGDRFINEGHLAALRQALGTFQRPRFLRL